jgi:hypothetical protein
VSELAAGNTLFTEALLNAVAGAIGPETVRFTAGPECEVIGVAERAAARVSFMEARRQGTIEQILRLAVEEGGAVKEKTAVDPGWLLRFFERAQGAGSELEEQVWARMLARETGTPGSFGRRTLDFLAGMDPWELEGFAEYCAFAFAFESGWRFMFVGEAAQREMWSYGRELDLSQHLINIGLLSAETALLKPTSRGLRIRYRDRIYELRGEALPEAAAVPPDAGCVYRKFTPIGQQLSEVIRSKSFFGYARNLIKTLNAQQGMAFELVEPPPEA